MWHERESSPSGGANSGKEKPLPGIGWTLRASSAADIREIILSWIMCTPAYLYIIVLTELCLKQVTKESGIQ